MFKGNCVGEGGKGRWWWPSRVMGRSEQGRGGIGIMQACPFKTAGPTPFCPVDVALITTNHVFAGSIFVTFSKQWQLNLLF